MLVQQAPQVGGLRVAGAVQREGLDTRDGHDRKGAGPGMVYAPSNDHQPSVWQFRNARPAAITPGLL
jgi:hypothetical protein